MKICVVKDLCLCRIKSAIQYSFLDFVIEDFKKKSADLLVIQGCISADKSAVSVSRLVRKLKEAEIPFYVLSSQEKKSFKELENNSFGEELPQEMPCFDMTKGENLHAIYYDTDTGKTDKSLFFCPVPNDIYDYVGIYCYNVTTDIGYAIKHNIRNLQFGEELFEQNLEDVSVLLSSWRKNGANELSLNIPFSKLEKACSFIDKLGIQRVVISDIEQKDDMTDTVGALTESIKRIPVQCNVSIENSQSPCISSLSECILLMKLLKQSCGREIGMCFDAGISTRDGKYPAGTWLSYISSDISGYTFYNLTRTQSSVEKYMVVSDFYNTKTPFASFFKLWNSGKINKAPVIFRIRGNCAYGTVIELLEKEKQRNICDLGSVLPLTDKLVQERIGNCIRIFGSCQYQNTDTKQKEQFFKKTNLLQNKYKEIALLCGVRITSEAEFDITKACRLVDYDYCIIEQAHIILKDELLEFPIIKRLRCGVTKTDMFEYCKRYSYNVLDYFREMARLKMFWLMDIDDEITKDFIQDKEKQKIVRLSGLCIATGAGEIAESEYNEIGIHRFYDFLKAQGIKTADELFYSKLSEKKEQKERAKKETRQAYV